MCSTTAYVGDLAALRAHPVFPFPPQAYVGSAVLSDEMAVAASPPPYTAYAAPIPEVGASLSVCGQLGESALTQASGRDVRSVL